MISVVIPTYNYNVYPLALELKSQLSKAEISHEIIVVDDASNSKLNIENDKINSLNNCSFISLDKNIGRSKIRNLLASKTHFDYLLFLDADIFPKNKEFISNYINAIKASQKVVVGGIAYKKDINSNLLRYKYGKKHEEVSFLKRQKNPSKYFFTANFLIKKSLFLNIKFDEGFKEYGYEDLVFAKQISEKSEKIHQIKNEVYHLGIDDNNVFLKKTKQAIKNLARLKTQESNLINDVKLMKVYNRLHKNKMIGFIAVFTSFYKLLASAFSSLFFFNLFRLGYLHKVIKNTK